MDILLAGIVGSTAYGLSHAGSDVDTLGVFAYPTRDVLRLNPPRETLTTTDPDSCLHEAAKYCRLALNMNPTVYELLWLDSYTTTTDHGQALVEIRDAFLSASQVRNSYLGYARAQWKRLNERGDGTWGGGIPDQRAPKHARHMARLLNQGLELYTTGNLTINVGDQADWYHEFSGADMAVWNFWFEVAAAKFETAKTILPEHANRDVVEDWLLDVRFDAQRNRAD